MAPVSWNGSNTLYHKAIKPFVLRHQKNIDEALDKVGEKMDAYAEQGKRLKKAKCFLPLANKQKQTLYNGQRTLHSLFTYSSLLGL